MERILITGASRGIGRAIAHRLAHTERILLLHGRDPAALNSVQNEVRAQGGDASVVIGDLTKDEGIATVLDGAGCGSLRALINNAGTAVVKAITEVELDEWNRSLALNVTAPYRLVRGLLPAFEQGSTIVNVLSVAARQGFSGWSAYCTAKFALEGFSQCLRAELRPRGIRVVNVYPSATDTELWSTVAGEWPRERMLAPERVADAVAWALDQPTNVLVETIALGDISGAL